MENERATVQNAAALKRNARFLSVHAMLACIGMLKLSVLA